MSKKDYIIRQEKENEYYEVEKLVREAFWNVYRPGCLEHYVLNQLRGDDAFVPELDLVMEKEGKLIGQIMFMKSAVRTDEGRILPVMTLGPICIAPEFHGQGYGKKLLDYSLEKATELGAGAVCLEGNIKFYGRSGFRPANSFGLSYPGASEGEDSPFFLCKELIPGYFDGTKGKYLIPQGYFVEESEAEEFDKKFPAKEKQKLPGQLF